MRRTILGGASVVLLFLLLSGQSGTIAEASLKQDKIYYHPSGLFSVRMPVGWEIPLPAGAKEAENNKQLAEADVAFGSRALASVIYISVSRYLPNPTANIEELNILYDGNYLRSFWQNYNNFHEVSRRTDGNRLIINMSVVSASGYYDSQWISQINNGWLVMVTVTVPANSDKLLADLVQFVLPTLTVYPSAANTPLTWTSIQDTTLGYFVKYPDNWLILVGKMGGKFLVSGALDNRSVLLTVVGQRNKTVQDQNDARQWVLQNISKDAEILAVRNEVRDDAKGYAVSYAQSAGVSFPLSGVAILLNGKNHVLYTLRIEIDLKDTDLLQRHFAQAPYNINFFRKSLNELPAIRSVPLRPVLTALPTVVVPTNTPVPPPESRELRALKRTLTAVKRDKDNLEHTLTALAPTLTPTPTKTPPATSIEF